MNAQVEAVMQRVHELVDKEVRAYLDQQIDVHLRNLSIEREVSYEVLRQDFQNSSSVSMEQSRCLAYTVLGNPCKYKAKKNDCLCKKHFNLLKCQKNEGQERHMRPQSLASNPS